MPEQRPGGLRVEVRVSRWRKSSRSSGNTDSKCVEARAFAADFGAGQQAR
ncbi:MULTISPECIES: DUF397 domain-containing protein [Glycomyces]